MKLNLGYKQTEVGVIPQDWQLKRIDELCIPSGLVRGPFGGALKKDCFVESGYKVYEQKNAIYSDVNLGNYYIDKNKFNELKRFEVLKDDFILSCSGTIGKIYQIPESFERGIINQALLKITLNNKLFSDKYFFHYFLWDKFQSNIIDNTQGGAMKNLVGMSVFKGTKIALPPTKSEQIAIAQALSDADAYITSLEKLIEKKKAIKQGAMQELLKPKDGWALKKLGDIGKTYGGLSGKSKDDFKDGVFPYIPFMNIMTNPVIDLEFLDFVNLKTGESQNSAQIGDLFFNGSSETPEEVGMCSILLADAPNLYLNSFCFGFRLKKELGINGLYLTYYFRSKEGRKLFYSMAQGATRYNLSKSNFNKLEVPIPRIEEQNFISNALRDMDFDIQLHEEKLNKAKSIKQGMMQNLLTGKIRLIK
jgi:type I restriction enzyme S subunit